MIIAKIKFVMSKEFEWLGQRESCSFWEYFFLISTQKNSPFLYVIPNGDITPEKPATTDSILKHHHEEQSPMSP